MPGKSHRSDYIILATLAMVTIAVCLVLSISGLLRENQQQRIWTRTTHSTNSEGTKACYLLFQRLGVSVGRLERPFLPENLEGLEVLFLLDPIVKIQSGELLILEQWITNGGVLVCSTDIEDDLTKLHGLRSSTFRSHSFSEIATDQSESNLPLPLSRDVQQVNFEKRLVLGLKKGAGADDLGPVVELYGDSVGLRIASRKMSAGKVVVLADSSFLSNGRISRQDNCILAANLLDYALSDTSGPSVAFDEYHQGFGYRQASLAMMAQMLFATSPGWAVLTLTAAGILYVFYKGRRFGTRRALGRPRRRSKLEFIEGVAATYRTAGANRLTLSLIYRWFKGLAAKTVGLPESTSSADVAAGLARRNQKNIGRYQAVFSECERALTRSKIQQRELKTLLVQLNRMELEITDGNKARK